MITRFCEDNTTFKGLSSDTKPLGMRNGDRFIEIDTGALLLYNEENPGWIPFVSNVDPASHLVGFGRVGYMIIE